MSRKVLYKGLETIINTFIRIQWTEIIIQFDKEGTFLKIKSSQDFWNTFFLLFLDYISETPQFVLSKQGKTQLVDSGGNIFYKHKGSQNNGKTSWKCTSYFKTKCKACFTTDDTSLCVLKSNKEHNHWAENSNKDLETIMKTFTRLQRTEIRIQFDKEISENSF